MGILNALLKTVRLPSTLLAFVSVLLPLLVRTNDPAWSIHKALPFLFGSMCTFIGNALDDLEKDAINHPERPLPSGELKPAFVAVVYYCCLAAALLSIRFGVGTHPISFLYYLLLVMAISYSYVVEYLPGIKPLYVALASTGPVVVLAQFYPRETGLYPVALAGLFFVFGRELCKDLPDRRGDPVSFLHRFEPRHIALASGACQAAGIVVLSFQVTTAARLLDLLLMGTLLVLAYVCWLRWGRLAIALGLMKGVNFLGLVYLL